MQNVPLGAVLPGEEAQSAQRLRPPPAAFIVEYPSALEAWYPLSSLSCVCGQLLFIFTCPSVACCMEGLFREQQQTPQR